MNRNFTDTARPAGPFYGRPSWIVFGIATIIALAVYAYSLAPSVTLADSGELNTAAAHLGVPHPPGYPLWTMIAFLFTRMFWFATFRGQPNPAWAVNFASTFFGSLTVGLLAMTIARSGRDILRKTLEHTRHTVPENRQWPICGTAGIATALVFAWTHAMWSQAVITEVYTLYMFLLISIFALLYRWMFAPANKLLYLSMLLFGMIVAGYYALLFAALVLTATIILFNDKRLFRDFAIAAFPYGLIAGLIYRGHLPGIEHPTHASFHIYLFVNFALLTCVFFFLPRGKTVAGCILLAQIGFGVYIYLPLASEFRNPPMNWAYPRTWQGFLHAVTRGQYERFIPTPPFSWRFVEQLGDYVGDLRMQFTLPIAMIGFLPLTAWAFQARGRKIHVFPIAAGLAIGGTALALLEKFLIAPHAVEPPGIYKFFLAPVIAMAGAGIAILLVGRGVALWRIATGKDSVDTSEKIVSALVLFLAVMFYAYAVRQLVGNIVEITAPLRETGVHLEQADISSMVYQTGGIAALILLPVFLSFFILRAMGKPFQLAMTMDEDSQKWILGVLLSFLAASITIIVLASPAGDIQDSYIQKVKFIASHALYAIWIGYGIVLALIFLDRAFSRHPAVLRAALVLTALLPLTPLVQNRIDRQLIKVYGSADQRGHDFGWQFGNFQLRGAEAILEELCPDEEPPPNPEFPEAMTPDAIFYGGTDPGRFVPTYMIYSARVREDVYLITQNALADNTYMSVMRDLYGDRIWIPSERDSAQAFHRFVDDIQAGRRPKPAHADLKIEDGRVQVTGALGVMEINGILAQSIFERNRDRHDFYIEESYVIRWMYPYLTPHGLIMKINRDPMDISRETVVADRDFWDWYARRLLARDDFLRDVAARKSFSKLRSAIAGLYASRNLRRDAEAAFQEARLLYPLSPEANFRIVQEVFLRQNRFAEAREVLETLLEKDPRNQRIVPFLTQVMQMQASIGRIAELEADLSKQKAVDVNALLQLGKLYIDAGRHDAFMRLGAQVMNNTNIPSIVHFRLAQMYSGIRRTNETIRALELARRDMPRNLKPEIYMEMVRMYAQAKQTDKMAEALDLYLTIKPGDYLARLDQATLRIQLKAPPEDVREALRLAIAHGGQEAVNLIGRNPLFNPYRDGLAPAPRPQAHPPLPGFPGPTSPPGRPFRPGAPR